MKIQRFGNVLIWLDIALGVLIAIFGQFYQIALSASSTIAISTRVERYAAYYLLTGVILISFSIFGIVIKATPWFRLTNQKGERLNLRRDLHSVPKVITYMVEGAQAQVLSLIVLIIASFMTVSLFLKMLAVIQSYY